MKRGNIVCLDIVLCTLIQIQIPIISISNPSYLPGLGLEIWLQTFRGRRASQSIYAPYYCMVPQRK